MFPEALLHRKPLNMNKLIYDILTQFESQEVVFLPGDKLNQLLDSVELLNETDTLVSDFIRLLKYTDKYIIQEKSPKNEILLRLFSAENTAKNFLEERLRIYEKMWDGCGCKINYYS